MMCRQLMDMIAEQMKYFSPLKIIVIPSEGDSKEVSSIMANVSARIDDDLKARADAIADQIGISLSSAIGIFLKRFVAEQGFPFPVFLSRSSLSCCCRSEIFFSVLSISVQTFWYFGFIQWSPFS